MDQFAATISAACTQAMQGLRDEVEELKVNHYAAIDLFRNRFAELRKEMTQQASRIEGLDKETATLKANQIDELQYSCGDAFHKDLQQVKQNAFSTKQQLLEKIGALQDSQNQQAAGIQRLNRSLLSSSTNNEHPASGTEFEALKRQHAELAEKLNTVETQPALLLQSRNEQGAQLKRLSDAVGMQQNYVESLSGARDFLAQLQHVQKNQVRMIEIFAAEQDGLKEAVRRLEMQGSMMASTMEPQALGAHSSGAVAQLGTRMDANEMKFDGLRRELLVITQMILRVIRQMNVTAQEGDMGISVVPGVQQQEQTVNPMDLLLLHDEHIAADDQMAEGFGKKEPKEVTSVPGGFVIGDEGVQESIEADDASGQIHTVEIGIGLEQSPIEPETITQVQPISDEFGRKPPPIQCHGCGRTNSASYHRGPAGPKTLCNTCSRKQGTTKRQFQPQASRDVDDKTNGGVSSNAGPRDASTGSMSTSRGHKQKEELIKEVENRALKRKKGLSPLKETFPTEEEAVAKDATLSLDNSAVKLTKTGYNMPQQSSVSGSLATPTTLARDVGEVSTTDGNATKRKRLTADEKARLSATVFTTDSGAEAEKKRRRTIAAKTVRFNFGDRVEGSDWQDEESTVKAKHKAEMIEGDQSKGAATDGEIKAIGTSKPRVRGGKTGRTASHLAPKPTPTTNVEEDKDVDCSSDNIVVARPDRFLSRRSPSVEIPSSGHKDMGSNGKTMNVAFLPVGVRSGTMQSQEELALPVRGSPAHGFSTSNHADISTSVTHEKKVSDYQTLLSAFNLGGRAAASGEKADLRTSSNASKPKTSTATDDDNHKENFESVSVTAGNAGRPKRVAKPKKPFGQVIDWTTMSEDELGD